MQLTLFLTLDRIEIRTTHWEYAILENQVAKQPKAKPKSTSIVPTLRRNAACYSGNMRVRLPF